MLWWVTWLVHICDAKLDFTLLRVPRRLASLPDLQDILPRLLRQSAPTPRPAWPKGGSRSSCCALRFMSPENFAELQRHQMEIRRQLTNEADLFYLIVAELGTPRARIRLIVDTGSSDLWVKNTSSCSESCTLGFGYSAAKSSSCGGRGERASVSYGQGQVLGYRITDTICLKADTCIHNQPFVLATTVVDIGNADFYDGLLGLAYPDLSQSGGSSPSFLEHLSDSEHFRQLGFGLMMRGEADVEDSRLLFGELDDLLKEARTNFSHGVTLGLVDIHKKAMLWLVAADVSVGDHRLQPSVTGESQFWAALDSGTSLLAVPEADFWYITDFIVPEGTVVHVKNGQIFCTCDVQLRPVIFDFTGSEGQALTVTLTSEDLLKPVSGAWLHNRYYPICRVGIMAGPKGMPFWILGDIFLRRVYVVHDVNGQQVTLFLQLPHSTRATTTPSLGSGPSFTTSLQPLSDLATSFSDREIDIEAREVPDGSIDLTTSALGFGVGLVALFGVFSMHRKARNPPLASLDTGQIFQAVS